MVVNPPSCLQAAEYPGGPFDGCCCSNDVLHESILTNFF